MIANSVIWGDGLGWLDIQSEACRSDMRDDEARLNSPLDFLAWLGMLLTI
jgi:hypothetical protein